MSDFEIEVYDSSGVKKTAFSTTGLTIDAANVQNLSEAIDDRVNDLFTTLGSLAVKNYNDAGNLLTLAFNTPHINGGRLGLPVSSTREELPSTNLADRSSSPSYSTIRYSPYTSNIIGLWDETYGAWIPTTFSQTDIGLVGVNSAFLPIDIFAYRSGSSVVFELLGWNPPPAAFLTSITAAGVITYSGSSLTSAANGKNVVIRNTSQSSVNNRMFNLQTNTQLRNLNTSVYSELACTGGTITYVDSILTRATALTRYDGVWCKNNDKTRKYIGTFMTNEEALVQNTLARAFIYNAYNRKNLPVAYKYTTIATGSWTIPSNQTWRPAKNDYAHRVYFVIGLPERIQASYEAMYQPAAINPTASSLSTAITLSTETWTFSDTSTTVGKRINTNFYANASSQHYSQAGFDEFVGAGNYYINPIESVYNGPGTNVTVYTFYNGNEIPNTYFWAGGLVGNFER